MCTLLKTLDKFVKSKYNFAMENLEESTKEINGAKNAVKKVITVIKVNDEKWGKNVKIPSWRKVRVNGCENDIVLEKEQKHATKPIKIH